MVLFACAATYLAVQRYLPYVSPENVCFSRNGVALGGPEACRQASPQALLEAQSATGLTARTPWTRAKLFRDVVRRCWQICQKELDCSFYTLRPQKIGAPQTGGLCVIYK